MYICLVGQASWEELAGGAAKNSARRSASTGGRLGDGYDTSFARNTVDPMLRPGCQCATPLGIAHGLATTSVFPHSPGFRKCLLVIATQILLGVSRCSLFPCSTCVVYGSTQRVGMYRRMGRHSRRRETRAPYELQVRNRHVGGASPV